jgi:hypothetical protein
MHSRTSVVLLLVAALGAAAALAAGLPGRLRRAGPPPPRGAVPRDAESLAVRDWVLQNRPDAGRVRFVAWRPPEAVPDNPFTHEPCTLVRVALQKAGGPEESHPLELYDSYVKGGQVLGIQALPAGFTDVPRATRSAAPVP